MELVVKGERYHILDVVQTTSHRGLAYNIFYFKSNQNKLYWILYRLTYGDREIMTEDEVLLFAIHNKHNADKEVVGERLATFISVFTEHRYATLKGQVRKLIIQRVLDED